MLLRELGEGRLEVHTLLPPGASPHTFEARPRDLRSLASADWVLRVGAGFDEWAAALMRATEREPHETVLLALPGLEALPRRHHDEAHGDELFDPHVWLDPVRVRDVVVPALVESLIHLDPGGAAGYRAAAPRFRAELDRLHAELTELFAASNPSFVSLHPAWAYLASRYGLREVGVVETVAGEAPSPRRLVSLVRESRAQHAQLVLVEPQIPTAIVRALAEELDAEIRSVDPLGNPGLPERSRYRALMLYNAGVIAGQRAVR